jgi:cell division protein ZapA (FtsZ GTPase activity inhibitor)
MTSNKDGLEYNILGCKVRLKADPSGNASATNAVEMVMDEIAKLRKINPNLKDTEVAVLVALNFASSKYFLEQEFKGNISELKASVKKALGMIEGADITL